MITVTASQILNRWERRINAQYTGQRGVTARRALITHHRQRLAPFLAPERSASYQQTRINKALGLARMAGMYFDEHGSTRGDYLSTRALDYVSPKEAAVSCHDLGRGGLGLVEVTRRRVYASSSKWYPATTSTRYMVGRNEAGTFFAHAVPNTVSSVGEALDWIWSGNHDRIIVRQGDIALIMGRGPKYPPTGLPAGHVVNRETITHATHPAIPAPGSGQRIIIGRRAMVRASAETRD